MKSYMPDYYQQNKSQMIKQIKTRRKQRAHENKKKAIRLLGGKCTRCGYDKCIAALDFHHIDGKMKDYEISKIISNWVKMKQEIKKCVLLCSNCHREEHYAFKE